MVEFCVQPHEENYFYLFSVKIFILKCYLQKQLCHLTYREAQGIKGKRVMRASFCVSVNPTVIKICDKDMVKSKC